MNALRSAWWHVWVEVYHLHGNEYRKGERYYRLCSWREVCSLRRGGDETITRVKAAGSNLELALAEAKSFEATP